MRPPELIEIMNRRQMKTKDLAIMAGVTMRAAQKWISGQNPIPRSVALVLYAMENNRVSDKWIGHKIVRMGA